MRRMYWGAWTLALVGLMALPLQAGAQGDHGEGQGGGCGDVFGDLIHIKRHAVTGQPILAKRWIELPKDIPGYGWGYCPIAVDELGNELGFAPLSCDVAEEDAERVVEVDYFGRLNGGRTKPRNQRMHFNEVIDNIKASCIVKQEETGRLKIGYCGDDGKLEEWAIVDSPMESMGLYIRLMKYGHIQTDPTEEDYWAHGDPATMPQFQPALGPEDWLKFDKSVQHLLPGWSQGVKFKSGEEWGDNDWITSCFADDEAEWFNPACAAQEELSSNDFIRAGSFLAGAANKTGFITRDLVQYFNRIGKVMTGEGHTVSPPNTLPALVRECTVEGDLNQDEEQDEPAYTSCSIINGGSHLANAEWFPDVTEKFVDFGAVEYDRLEWRDETVEGVFPLDAEDGLWQVYAKPLGFVVPLTGWLAYVNGPDPMSPGYYNPTFNIEGFVESAKDGVRSIEFVHNHAVPVDLWPEYFAIAVPQMSFKTKSRG